MLFESSVTIVQTLYKGIMTMSGEIKQELRLTYEELVHVSKNIKRNKKYFQIIISLLIIQAVISLLILFKP